MTDKSPTQEEVREAWRRIKAHGLIGKEDGIVYLAYAQDFALVEAALEAKAHSEADCLRVAAEWLDGVELWSPYLESHQPMFAAAIRAEADRLEARP